MTGLDNKLLVHAVPGARSGFIAAWCNKELCQPGFDIGVEIGQNFTKVHWVTEENKSSLDNAACTKLKIDFNTNDLSTIGALFLKKTLAQRYPGVFQDEFSLNTYTKIVEFLKHCLQAENENPRLSSYNYIIPFKDTFDINYLIDLYQSINHSMPADLMIKSALETNEKNSLTLDPNHACSIAQLTLSKEIQLGLNEANRFWSIVDVYNSTPTAELYSTVEKLINPSNYGILLK